MYLGREEVSMCLDRSGIERLCSDVREGCEKGLFLQAAKSDGGV